MSLGLVPALARGLLDETPEPGLGGRLLPDAVVRVGGLPADELEDLRAVRTLEAWQRLRLLEGRQETARESATEALFEAVGGCQDPERRRLLLRLKRDIHNGRSVRAKLLKAVQGGLGAEPAAKLELWAELQARCREAAAEAHRLFDEELLEARRRFQRRVQDEDFRKGLLLSSRTLFRQMPRYVRASPAKLGAKQRQVERSLLRYFSRTALKATPFGTFCAILPGRLEGSAAGPGGAALVGDPRPKRSRLRLNKAFYGQLLPHLVKRPEIRRRLAVELNPTLQQEGDRRLFLSAAGGQETFQRLAANPVVDLLVNLLEEAGPTRLDELVSALCAHPQLEASRQEGEAYLERLFDLGLLRFRLGIRDQEVHWDQPLAALLEGMDDELAQRTAAFLRHLRRLSAAYSQASATEREPLLEEAQAAIADLFEFLQAPVPATLPPFYEDAGGEAEVRFDIGDLEEVLAEFVALTTRMSWHRGELANMRHFFNQFYGPAVDPVPLLRFYEDYFREHFKAYLEKQNQGSAAAAAPEDEEEKERPEEMNLANPFGLDFLRRLQQAQGALTRRLAQLWREDPQGEEIVLEREDLTAALEGLPERSPGGLSTTVFGQLLPGFGAGGAPALVTSSTLCGYGKYFSRFLYLLPEDVQERLRGSNLALTGQRLAEVCGDAGFNANLHPPLVPWELSYPTGESGAAEEQIPVGEIHVATDPEDPHRLTLRQGPDGPEVIPLDLGFLNPRMRPPLFQLLSRLGPAAAFGLPAPEAPAETAPETSSEAESFATPDGAGKVQVRPRISYRGRLVLARRRWKIGAALFPRRQGQESDADYFLRVQGWREELGLPQEVFVRVQILPPVADAAVAADADLGSPGSADREEESDVPAVEEPVRPEVPVRPARTVRTVRPVRQHLYKPQFLDFGNPLLVDLFSRLGDSLENFALSFEERLPRREHLVKAGQQAWATELVLQVDFSEAKA
jgi:hypothetical protein